VAKTRPRDDLFVVFPDLPWARVRTATDQVEKVRRQVQETRKRAEENILRQKAATARVREAVTGRTARLRAALAGRVVSTRRRR
jgi:hypothetical protein